MDCLFVNCSGCFFLTVFGIPQIQNNFKAPDLLSGFVGGERYNLLVRNEKVKALLLKENLQITEGSVTKKGSISQLSFLKNQPDLGNLDFIWTGDAPIASGGKQLIEASGKTVLENEATLSDPLVLVVDKKAAQSLADRQFFMPLDANNPLKKNNFSHQVDAVTFAAFLEGNLTWQDLGLIRYVSPPGIIMSDARQSNGGLMAETLIGTIWHNLIINGLSDQPNLPSSSQISQFQPLPSTTPPQLVQKMQQLRLHSGFAESTSSKIKVQLEEGGIPWALTYYSVGKQIIEANAEFTLVALSHTVVNSNQFLAFSENGIKLLRIIQSQAFQKIAKDYGYDDPQGDWIVLSDPSFEAVRSLANLLENTP